MSHFHKIAELFSVNFRFTKKALLINQIVTTIWLMKIEFDGDKNDRNIHDRNLPFERATDFDFNTAIVRQDVRKQYPEVRYVALGFLEARLHVLCFTPVDDGIRVISFRKANPREIRDYEQAYPPH